MSVGLRFCPLLLSTSLLHRPFAARFGRSRAYSHSLSSSSSFSTTTTTTGIPTSSSPSSDWWSMSSNNSNHSSATEAGLLGDLRFSPRWFHWLHWFVAPHQYQSAQHLAHLERQMLIEGAAELRLDAQSLADRHRWVAVQDDLRISTYQFGRGPPLVLLHGFGAGSGFWARNLAPLAEQYTCYLLDLPGFGRSSRPAQGRPRDAAQAEAFFLDSLHLWAQQMGLQRFALLGHSFGGFLAATYAIRHPEQVSHLILADPWGVPERPAEPASGTSTANGSTFRSLLMPVVRQLLTWVNPLSVLRLLGPYGPDAVARVRSDLVAKFQDRFQDPTVVAHYIYHLNAQSPAVGEEAFGRLSLPIGWSSRPLLPRADQLPAHTPVSLIYGAHSWMQPRYGIELARLLNQQSPHRPHRARFFLIPDAGHHVYVDAADQFNGILLAELSRGQLEANANLD